jgi:putative acetyltransferase
MIVVRPEEARDAPELHRLLEAAFGGPAEAELVGRLRRDGDLVLSLVAVADGEVVGHAGFPRLVLKAEEKETAVCGLAPLAVRPDRQRQGTGSALARQGLAMLTERGESLVFVLGAPDYYRRFGFEAGAAAGFACVYAGPYFQVLRLSRAAPSSGAIRYPRAFDDLG